MLVSSNLFLLVLFVRAVYDDEYKKIKHQTRGVQLVWHLWHWSRHLLNPVPLFLGFLMPFNFSSDKNITLPRGKTRQSVTRKVLKN